MEKVKTTITINEKLKREVQIYCLNEGLTMSNLIEKLLKKEMEKGRAKDE